MKQLEGSPDMGTGWGVWEKWPPGPEPPMRPLAPIGSGLEAPTPKP